jgi:hypothetical protein
MPDTASAPRWIVVVRRDRADLFASLKRAFPGGGPVEPVLDRRLGDRRQDGLVVVPNRRRRTRRRKPAARDLTLWDVAGFRLTDAAGAAVERLPVGEAPVETPAEVPVEVAEVIAAALATPQPVPVAAPVPAPSPAVAAEASAVVPLALQPALPGLAGMVGSLEVADPDGERLRLLVAWLDVCREALPTERLDLCRAYLGVAVRTLAAARPAPSEPGAGGA